MADDAKPDLEARIAEALGFRAAIGHGPRARDLTVRLSGPEDLAAAAETLAGALGMSLATLVATDETETADRDLKVRYVFEPRGPDPTNGTRRKNGNGNGGATTNGHGAKSGAGTNGGTGANGTGANGTGASNGYGANNGYGNDANNGNGAGRPVPALEDRFVTLLVALDPEHAEVPSLTTRLPGANWHEREARDLFGVTPAAHPDPRTLVVHDGWPPDLFPLRKKFDASTRPPRLEAEELPHLVAGGEGVFEIPVGPIHAGIIEPGHFRFTSIGETILNLDARLFYTHRGLEKRIEGLSPAAGLRIAERMCGVCSVAHALGFCEAAEQIGELEVPPKARLLRGIALELERLYNHAGDIGNICAGLSYHYGTSAGLRIKEGLQQLNERVAGNRFLRGWLVPGGVSLDLTTELRRALEATIAGAERSLEDLVGRIEKNPSVVDRLDGTGVLPRQAAVDLCVTGVAARASGVSRDARRDHPHAAFAGPDALAVEVPTAEECDVHARLTVRAKEAVESIHLIGALLDRLEHAAGPLSAPPPAAWPGGRIGLASTESPRGASVHWLRLDEGGRIDRYHLRSASFANWPAVPLAALTAIVPDFPLVNKSFELCYACTDR